MTKQERANRREAIDRYLDDMRAQGKNWWTTAPLLVRLAWRLGILVRPPAFWSIFSTSLYTSIFVVTALTAEACFLLWCTGGPMILALQVPSWRLPVGTLLFAAWMALCLKVGEFRKRKQPKARWEDYELRADFVAFERVRRGLAQSSANKTIDRGSFAQYADESDDIRDDKSPSQHPLSLPAWGEIFPRGEHWIARVPRLDVMTQGHSLEDARYMLEDALNSLHPDLGAKVSIDYVEVAIQAQKSGRK